MPDLMEIARRFLKKPGTPTTTPSDAAEGGALSSLNSFLSSDGPGGNAPSDGADGAPLNSYHSFNSSQHPTGWGCLLGEVQRLLIEADEHFATTGLPGNHPEVVQAAEMVTSALLSDDIDCVRFALSEFNTLVRSLASPQNPSIFCLHQKPGA